MTTPATPAVNAWFCFCITNDDITCDNNDSVFSCPQVVLSYGIVVFLAIFPWEWITGILRTKRAFKSNNLKALLISGQVHCRSLTCYNECFTGL
jgi:hypothetical protein